MARVSESIFERTLILLFGCNESANLECELSCVLRCSDLIFSRSPQCLIPEFNYYGSLVLMSIAPVIALGVIPLIDLAHMLYAKKRFSVSEAAESNGMLVL